MANFEITIVYRLVNLANGKCYFGITKRGGENRRKEHFRAALNGSKMPIHRAIRKHGMECFSFEIVGMYPTRERAIEKEIQCIAGYPCNYNATKGGDGVSFWLGKKRSAETIAKIAATKTGVKRGNLSDLEVASRRDNIKNSHIRQKKPVICLTDGRRFSSATEADSFYGFKRLAVAPVANGRRNSIFGFKFVYERIAV